MKFTLALCFLVILAIAHCALSPDEEHCRDGTGASDEDIEAFESLRQPESRTTKCYYSCMMQVLKYSDGKRFNKEGFLKTMMLQAKNDEERQAVVHLADQCEGTENSDHCELAADIVACFLR